MLPDRQSEYRKQEFDSQRYPTAWPRRREQRDWERQTERRDNPGRTIAQLIGNTPLLRLSELSSINEQTTVYGKIEYFNPGLSIKDRTALGLIQDAILAGKIRPGDSIVESTSGNTGVALAMLCASMGFHFICIIDPKTPAANIRLYQAFGAEVVVVTETDKDGGYQKTRIQKAREIARSRANCFNLDQYANPAAWRVHYRTTGPEISNALAGQVDGLVASVSTGGHLTGIATYLKECRDEVTVVGAEPEGSVIFGGEFKPYRTNGAGLSFKPANYNDSIVDIEERFSDDEAFAMVRRLTVKEGLLVGASSGGVLAVAERLIRRGTLRGNIVAVLPDNGLKYLETIFADPIE